MAGNMPHIKSVEFIKSGTRPKHFPEGDLPEVAFAGRSNVGKSSLINALVGRKSLVKVSGTPGRTQLVNFFEVNGALSLVDLPGYGFAKVPEPVRRKWGAMIEGYFASRTTLRAVVVIMDLRRGVEEDDTQLIEALPHYGIQPILAFTKGDKFKNNARKNRVHEIAKEIGARPSDIIVTSATKRTGLDVLWKRIIDLSGAAL
jgi:GTP-binding protein